MSRANWERTSAVSMPPVAASSIACRKRLPNMSNSPTRCEPGRIELFLRQQLSDCEQTDFERHLDECPDCRQMLESHAARADVWAAVKESLGSDAIRWDSDCKPGVPADSEVVEHEESPPAIESFRNLLAPTDDPRMLGRLGGYEIVGL